MDITKSHFNALVCTAYSFTNVIHVLALQEQLFCWLINNKQQQTAANSCKPNDTPENINKKRCNQMFAC